MCNTDAAALGGATSGAAADAGSSRLAAMCTASDNSRNTGKRGMGKPDRLELNLFDNYLHLHVNVV